MDWLKINKQYTSFGSLSMTAFTNLNLLQIQNKKYKIFFLPKSGEHPLYYRVSMYATSKIKGPAKLPGLLMIHLFSISSILIIASSRFQCIQKRCWNRPHFILIICKELPYIRVCPHQVSLVQFLRPFQIIKPYILST